MNREEAFIMLNVHVSISEIDYEAALDTIMPIFLEHMSQNSDHSFLSTVLSKTKNLSSAAAKTAIKALPEKSKEELAVVCFNHYKESIIQMLTEAAAEKGIVVKMDDITVTAES